MIRVAPVCKALLSSLLMALAPLASASAQEAAESQILKAMQYDAGKKSRTISTGEAIRALIQSGHLIRKPEGRYDYNDVRLIRKPLRLFGYDILIIEEEYFIKYIGCCVNQGIGLMITGRGNMKSLEDFARQNSCSVESNYDARELARQAGLKPDGRSYLYVSCRERDANS